MKHLVYTLVCAIFAQICEISGFMNKYIKSKINQLKTHPRWVRNPLGFLLVFGGVLGALPILGFWMIPLGLVILSVDYRWAKRALTRLKLAWRRIRNRFRQHFGARPVSSPDRGNNKSAVDNEANQSPMD